MAGIPFDPTAFPFNGFRFTAPSADGSDRHVLSTNGSGVTSLRAPVSVSEVLAYTGNGQGSTNTKIRRYTSSTTVSGTGITYADSAANGASFTCNTAGLALMVRVDGRAAAACNFGFSLNSSQGTTAIESITYTNIIGYAVTAAAGFIDCSWGVRYVAVNDVIRPHDGFNVPDSSTSQIAMTRVILLQF